MDVAPADGLNNAGTFGASNGSWGANGFSFGAPFNVLADGILRVTVYDYFADPGLNAQVNEGTLRVFFQQIPEPGTYLLMCLGLLGVTATARRLGKRE